MVAHNATLPPGLTTLNMTGVVRPAPGALHDMSELFSNYLNGVDTPISVRGEGVIFGDGIATPSWLLQAVRNISMSTMLPGVKNLTLTSNLEIVSLNMSFVPPPSAIAAGLAITDGS